MLSSIFKPHECLVPDEVRDGLMLHSAFDELQEIPFRERGNGFVVVGEEPSAVFLEGVRQQNFRVETRRRRIVGTGRSAREPGRGFAQEIGDGHVTTG
jgi:hypothetical protein